MILFVCDWGVGFSLYELNKFNDEIKSATLMTIPINPNKFNKVNNMYLGMINSPTTYEITNSINQNV